MTRTFTPAQLVKNCTSWRHSKFRQKQSRWGTTGNNLLISWCKWAMNVVATAEHEWSFEKDSAMQLPGRWRRRRSIWNQNGIQLKTMLVPGPLRLTFRLWLDWTGYVQQAHKAKSTWQNHVLCLSLGQRSMAPQYSILAITELHRDM